MPNAQMNFRIDAELKRKGDERFAALGCTPSGAMRRLYECAARYDEESEAVLRALVKPTAAQSDDAGAKRERAVYEFQEQIVGRYRALGLVPGSCSYDVGSESLTQMLYDELEDKMAERGLL